MRFTQVLFMLFALAMLAAPARAVESERSIEATNAWVRAPAPGQKTAAAYVELTSSGNAALVEARSPAARAVEIHSSAIEGGVMRMRAVPRIELPAGKMVKLAPGGVHLMLVDLKQPLKAGGKVPLTLSVQRSGATAGASLTTIELEAEIRAADGGSAHKH
jgi:copper(I)-binding protein